jgi:NAD-reducing hydrogenase small subunit
MGTVNKIRLATIWLGGCSGCHMSFLDLDEWLFDLAAKADVVFSPVADVKEFPANVDVTLVEGAVANEDNLALIKCARANSKLLISFGDCAVTGNVTALRNVLGDGNVDAVLDRAYKDVANLHPRLPDDTSVVPPLLERVMPVHAVVPVDVYLPGCPPPALRIRALLEQLLTDDKVTLEGREMLKFG